MSAPPALFKDFTFPLNVCAYALELEEGSAEDLHHGLFMDGITNLREAQAHSTELLVSMLPTRACEILDVGVGLGTTLEILLGKGHKAQGISPDPSQIAYVRSRLGADAPLTCVRIEDFVAASQFDFILFQESAKYTDPLDLFNKAMALLKPGGRLLILDEFARSRVGETDDGLYLIEDFKKLSSRFGFKPVEQLDLSDHVLQNLNFLLRMIEKNRERLCEDLGTIPGELEKLDASSRRHQNEYAAGHREYALLQLEKGETPRWRLSRIGDSDKNEMLGLFEQSFGYRMNPALWHWKYGSGRGLQMGVWSGSELVAHYGGMPRAIQYFGASRSAVQIGDVMVLGSERGVMTRSGPFFLMASSFLERYIGLGKPFLLGFGFPQERAMRLAERLGLYADVGRMVEMAWTPLPRTPKWLTRLSRVTTADANAHQQIDELWVEMAADLANAVVGVRNWNYLRHRYFEHPTNAYEVYVVRRRLTGGCVGVLVLRRTEERCELIDLVAPLRAIPALVVHARRLAGLGGSTSLHCGITENFSALFSEQEGVKKDMDIRIPTSILGAVPDPECIKNRWWLMLGDTDFR